MYGRITIGLLLAAAMASAQAAQATKPTIAEQLRGGTSNQQLRSDLASRGTAGAGYVQQDFFKTLLEALKRHFNEKRAGELYQHLMGVNVDLQDVKDLMNGKRLTESKLIKLFGATRDELDRLRLAIEEALNAKNRKLFFGILLQTMADSGTTDNTVLKQTGGAVDSMSQANFEKLLRGTVSTATISDAFGLSDKGSCKQMQDALNAMRDSPLVNHPMCESMGMANRQGFKPEGFAKPAEGMPGCGGEFADGKAGGVPLDPELPPLPFAGENMGFGGCHEGGDAGGTGGEVPAGG